MMRLVPVLILCFTISVSAYGAAGQSNLPLTNNDIIRLKEAGLRDDVIILTINSGPAMFKTEAADLVALKKAGVSDAVIAAMLKSPKMTTGAAAGNETSVDLSRAALIRSFESSVTDADAASLPDATRAAVIQVLKTNRMFSALLGPEEAAGKQSMVDISAELVDFSPGNMAERLAIGLGTGRAHAGFLFTVKDSATGKVLWKKTIKETASFWSNSASSSAQRSELPEKVAKAFVEELQKAKIPELAR